MMQKTKGIVLRRRFMKEIDSFFYLLAESGETIEIRAYGIRTTKKRSALLMEPGAFIEVDYQTDLNGHSTLKEGHVQERFRENKMTYHSLLLLSYLLELSAFTSSYGKAPSLFVLLKGSIETLSKVDTVDSDHIALLIFFQSRLLKLLGILGTLDSCSLCDADLTGKSHWHIPELYFSCDNCNTKSRREDRLMAEIIAIASKVRFSIFEEIMRSSHSYFGNCTNLKNKGKIFDIDYEWKGLDKGMAFSLCKKLHLCVKNFANYSFPAFRQLEENYMTVNRSM